MFMRIGFDFRQYLTQISPYVIFYYITYNLLPNYRLTTVTSEYLKWRSSTASTQSAQIIIKNISKINKNPGGLGAGGAGAEAPELVTKRVQQKSTNTAEARDGEQKLSTGSTSMQICKNNVITGK